MVWRGRRLGLVAAAGGVGLAIALAFAARPALITEADYRRLRPGMTAAEVERVLGGPPRNLLKRRGTVWVSQADGNRVSAFLDAGRAYPHFFPQLRYDEGQAVWVTPTGLVAVASGRDGRLRDRYFSTVEVSNGPSVWNWLGSRPEQIRRALGL